jgi:membrane-associated phospholipid phosphatase
LRSFADPLSGNYIKAHDLVCFLLSLLFAVFSLAWHSTGEITLGGAVFSRGYPMAGVYLLLAAFALAAGPLEAKLCSKAERRGTKASALLGRLASFIHTYYPQALFAVFFTESILLSAQAFGGLSHDAFFEASDQAIFGFQPAREFSKAFGTMPWVNELMFGAYFGYFAFMVVAIWLPYLKGDRAEGERQVFVVASFMAILCTWYVFFRVQGPKYWLPDLNDAWYDDIKGGFFVGLFQRSLSKATLSGAAFPSTHVIITLTTLGFSYRNDKRFFAIYLPVAILILCATVYIYAHWATDVLGGALVAALLGPLLYRLYEPAARLAGRIGSSAS